MVYVKNQMGYYRAYVYMYHSRHHETMIEKKITNNRRAKNDQCLP